MTHRHNPETGKWEETVVEDDKDFVFSTTTNFPIERLKKNKNQTQEDQIEKLKEEETEEEETEPLALEEIEKEPPTYYEAQKKEIEEESKTKKVFKIIGITVLVLLVVASWFFGFFGIVFYILGFYVALYFLSLLFKTTTIIDTIIVIGGIILHLGFLVLV